MSPAPRDGQQMGCHPLPRREHFITGTPLHTQPRCRDLPGIPAPTLSLPIFNIEERITASFMTSKDIQCTSSQLSIQWLTAPHGGKNKFISSLNLSGFSLQLLNNFIFLLFFLSFPFLVFFLFVFFFSKLMRYLQSGFPPCRYTETGIKSPPNFLLHTLNRLCFLIPFTGRQVFQTSNYPALPL